MSSSIRNFISLSLSRAAIKCLKVCKKCLIFHIVSKLRKYKYLNFRAENLQKLFILNIWARKFNCDIFWMISKHCGLVMLLLKLEELGCLTFLCPDIGFEVCHLIVFSFRQLRAKNSASTWWVVGWLFPLGSFLQPNILPNSQK